MFPGYVSFKIALRVSGDGGKSDDEIVKWQSKERCSLTWEPLGPSASIFFLPLLLWRHCGVFLGKWNIILRKPDVRRMCVWGFFLHTVEVDATYLLCYFKGCCYCFDMHTVHLDFGICLDFSIGKLQQQSGSQTFPPDYFLPSTFTSEKTQFIFYAGLYSSLLWTSESAQNTFDFIFQLSSLSSVVL